MCIEADLKLWRSFRFGSREALESIYIKYATDLFNYGTKFCADTSLIQDEIHNLFVYLFEKRKSLSSEVSLLPYLMVSLRRRILVRLKESADLIEGNEEFFNLDISFEDKIIKSEIEQEISSSIKSAIAKLSEREREIIFLKYFANMSNADISEVMQINDQATRNLLSKALSKMRNLMPNTRILSSILLFF